MNSNLTIFNYEGNNVTFYKKDGILFINATEMAKPFGSSKRPANWLKTSLAINYINEVSDATKIASADLQRVTRGNFQGGQQGTWLQEDVALAFAQWLSPKFHLWCNRKIKELLTNGSVTMTREPSFNVPQTFSEALMLAARQAKQIESDAKIITDQKQCIDKQNKQIEMMEEESEYCKAILKSNALVTTSSIAQDYGYSAKYLNKLLKDWGVQYQNNNQWILTWKYKDGGYVRSETINVKGNDGKNMVIVHTKWTQKGRMFLYQFLKKHHVLPIQERDANL